jgi:spermidine synthase
MFVNNTLRVHLHIADGAQFIANAPSSYYDVIIQDSSDPWTWSPDGQKIILPSSVLYSKEHFHHISRSLNTDGILVIQAESLQIPSDFNGIREWRSLALQAGFDKVQYGTIMISSYPTGQIGLLMCEKNSKTSASIDHIKQRYHNDIIDKKLLTTYYHPLLHTSTFTAIPKWAYQHIYSDDVDTTPTCLAPPSIDTIGNNNDNIIHAPKFK